MLCLILCTEVTVRAAQNKIDLQARFESLQAEVDILKENHAKDLGVQHERHASTIA
jgi:hypothetical protein